MIFDWMLRWGNVISGLGSLFLSSVLAYFYFEMKQTQQERTEIHSDQTEIQENQIELMKRQGEIMEAGQKPNIQVDGFKIVEREKLVGEGFKILISNIGKGHAYNLRIRIEPILEDPDNFCKKPTEHHAYEEDNTDDDMRRTEDNYIMPGTSEQPLIASSAMYLYNRSDSLNHPAVFEFVTEMLDEEGLDQFRFKLHVKYDSEFGEGHEHEFADLVVPVRGRTDFKIAMENSITYEQATERLGPPPDQRWSEIERDTGDGIP